MKRGVAHNFAQALLQSGVNPREAEIVLLALEEAMKQNEKIRLFLESPRYRKEEKKKFLEKAFYNKVDPLILNFLYVLVDRDRFMNFSEILQALIEEVDRRLSRLRVQVSLAFPWESLSEGEKSQLLKELQSTVEFAWVSQGYLEKKEYEYLWHIETNKNLLGGIKIKIGDYLLDGSVDRYLKDYLQKVREKKRQIEKSWLT